MRDKLQWLDKLLSLDPIVLGAGCWTRVEIWNGLRKHQKVLRIQIEMEI